MPLTSNSIQTIKNYVTRHNGLQLKNRFMVDFYNVPSYNVSDVEDIHASLVSLPPRAINSITDFLHGYGKGRAVPIAQDLLIESATKVGGLLISFPVTNDSFILDFFNRWFNYFYSSKFANPNSDRDQFTLPYYDDAVKNTRMVVRLLDPNGNVNLNMIFTEVFPAETQPIDLSMAGGSNVFIEYPVVFGYRDLAYQVIN